MADNVLVDNGELEDFTVSCDEGATGYVQRMKLTYSADGSEAHVEADADGLAVKLGQPIPPGTNAIGKLSANDGVDIGDVDVASVAGDVTVVQPTSSNLKGEMKITDGTDIAPVDPTNGLAVDVKAAAALPTGDNEVGRVKVTDGTTVATVRELGTNDAMNVAIVDGSGNQIVSFGGTGGTSSQEGTAHSGTIYGTPTMGVYESSPTSVDDGDMGVAAIDANRRIKVSVDASTLDKGHAEDDGGNPVKIGTRSVSVLNDGSQRPVTADDRANAISDLFGRILTSHISPEMQTWKSANYTTQQAAGSAASIWDPTAGKKIAITSIILSSYGTTGGRMFLFFADNADATYTAGTDQLVVAANFEPSSTVKPGLVFTPATPIFCNTADYELKFQDDAAISVDITVYGYEF